MEILATRDQFSCALMEPGDAEMAYNLSHLIPSGAVHGTPYRELPAAEREKFDHEFEHGKRRFFGLYDGQKLIGRAYVDFDPVRDVETGIMPTLTDSLVVQDYRGQKLSYLLFRARLGFLVAETNHPEARLFIDNKDPDSPPSKRSAIRHGFVMQDCCEIDDVEFHTRDLNALRPPRPGGMEMSL